MPPDASQPGLQVIWLFVLAIPVSAVAWTVTHEEVFREFREYCTRRGSDCPKLFQRKFFYALTCEFCLSHYVTIFFLVLTRYRLLLDDWRGYLLAFFALVWVANVYMSLYSRLRVDITAERAAAKASEKQVERIQHEIEENGGDKSS